MQRQPSCFGVSVELQNMGKEFISIRSQNSLVTTDTSAVYNIMKLCRETQKYFEESLQEDKDLRTWKYFQ